MDNKFKRNQWIPSYKEIDGGAPIPELSLKEFKDTVSKLRQLTRDLSKDSYCLDIWVDRAGLLLKLGYPELTLGDLYKTFLLIEEGLKALKESHSASSVGSAMLQTFGTKLGFWSDEHPGNLNKLETNGPLLRHLRTKLREQKADVYFLLLLAMCRTQDVGNALRWSETAVKEFRKDQRLTESLAAIRASYDLRKSLSARKERKHMSDAQFQDVCERGVIYMRNYPWMGARFVRDDDTLHEIQNEFTTFTDQCTVQKSPVQDLIRLSPKETDDAVFGLFATRDIPADSIVVEEHGRFVVTNGRHSCNLCTRQLPDSPFIHSKCSTKFCSARCADEAIQIYHSIICSKDYSFLTDAAQNCYAHTGNVDNLLTFRALAASIQEGAPHPLKSSFIGRLTPMADSSNKLLGFNFEEHIINPIKMLQVLDIDPFADQRYDTWVLFTILYRIDNNQVTYEPDTDQVTTACFLTLNMLNHSCDPNVWMNILRGPDRSQSNLKLVAKRNIQKGEELFSCYDPKILKEKDWGPEKRQARLMQELGGKCGCRRCVREMKTETERGKAEEEEEKKKEQEREVEKKTGKRESESGKEETGRVTNIEVTVDDMD